MYAGSARRGRPEATGGHVFELQLLQRALMQVVVAGISEISRAIISRKVPTLTRTLSLALALALTLALTLTLTLTPILPT